MSTSSRAQSQSSRYSRKRSNTAQSAYKSNTNAAPSPLAAPPSIKVGESKTLAAWVHDQEKSEKSAVIFNHNWWPGINEGDLLRVTLGNSDSGFLFFVPREDCNSVRPQLQVRAFLTLESGAWSSPCDDAPVLFSRYPFLGTSPRYSVSGTTVKLQLQRCATV